MENPDTPIRRSRGIVFVAACMGVLASSPASQSPAHEAIGELFERDFAQAWQAGDAGALAELWVADGDWSNVLGSRRVVRGTAAIREVWEVGLRGRSTAAELALGVAIDHVRLLDPGHAVVDLVMTFAPGTAIEIREAFVMVMVRVDERWRIASARAARLGP